MARHGVVTIEQGPDSDGVIETVGIRIWTDDYGQTLYRVHAPEACEGRGCPIHHPSEHRMVNWKLHYRFDRGLMERICEHGVGHPDPDDVCYQTEVLERGDHVGVHGCDGCCRAFITDRDPGDET